MASLMWLGPVWRFPVLESMGGGESCVCGCRGLLGCAGYSQVESLSSASLGAWFNEKGSGVVAVPILLVV